MGVLLFILTNAYLLPTDLYKGDEAETITDSFNIKLFVLQFLPWLEQGSKEKAFCSTQFSYGRLEIKSFADF